MRNYVKPFPCYSTYNAVYKVFNQIQVVRLKICDSHLTCKVATKCLNVRERVEVVESPPFPCCPVSRQCP